MIYGYKSIETQKTNYLENKYFFNSFVLLFFFIIINYNYEY